MPISRILIVALFLFLSNTSWAWRPLTVDDADTVCRGMYELDAGVAYNHDGNLRHWDFPFGLTYGFASNLDAHFTFGGQIGEQSEPFAGTKQRSGVGDLELGAKWLIIGSDPVGTRHSLAPLVKLPTASENRGLGSGAVDYDLTWIASRRFGDQTDIHLNLGYTWVGKAEDVVHYGLAAYYQVVGPVQWVGEVFAEKELSSGTETVSAFNTGIRYYVRDNLIMDIAAGTKVGGDSPNLTITSGLTWDFGKK